MQKHFIVALLLKVPLKSKLMFQSAPPLSLSAVDINMILHLAKNTKKWFWWNPFFPLKTIFKQDILPIKCSLEQTLCPTPRGRSSSIVEPYYCRSKHGLSIHVWLCIFPHFIPFSSYPIVEKKMDLSHFEEGSLIQTHGYVTYTFWKSLLPTLHLQHLADKLIDSDVHLSHLYNWADEG